MNKITEEVTVKNCDYFWSWLENDVDRDTDHDQVS